MARVLAEVNAPALLMWALLTMLVGLIVAAVITVIGPKVSMHALCLTSFFVDVFAPLAMGSRSL